MSVIVKHSSAFTPVESGSKSTSFSHPFSIKNLLNLDESSNDNLNRELVINTPNLPSNRSSVIIPPLSHSLAASTRLCYEDPAVQIPPWIYATRYCRQGIPSGEFNQDLLVSINQCIIVILHIDTFNQLLFLFYKSRHLWLWLLTLLQFVFINHYIFMYFLYQFTSYILYNCNYQWTK